MISTIRCSIQNFQRSDWLKKTKYILLLTGVLTVISTAPIEGHINNFQTKHILSNFDINKPIPLEEITENIKREVKIGYLTANTNVRKIPSLDADVLNIFPINTKVEYFDYNEEWLQIKYKNNYAFIWKKLVSNTPIDYISFGVPSNGIKSFMPYQAITNRDSKQYNLQQYCDTASNGIRTVNGRYCVAIGSAYTTEIGRHLDLILENGTVIPCILADCKADKDTDERNILTNDGSLAEFIVNMNSLSSTVMRTGDISYAEEMWNSQIVTIKIYDRKEEF